MQCFPLSLPVSWTRSTGMDALALIACLSEYYLLSLALISKQLLNNCICLQLLPLTPGATEVVPCMGNKRKKKVTLQSALHQSSLSGSKSRRHYASTELITAAITAVTMHLRAKGSGEKNLIRMTEVLQFWNFPVSTVHNLSSQKATFSLHQGL